MHLGFHSPGHRRAMVPSSGGGQRWSNAAPHDGRTFRPCGARRP
jgi:hypothetical protein